MSVKMLGPHLAREVFQVHGIPANGTVIFYNAIIFAPLLAFFATLPVCVF